MQKKELFIADLAACEEGKHIDGFFLILSRQLATTKANKQYMKLVLGDKTGQLDAVAWELGDAKISREVERGDIVKVRAEFSRYNDPPSSSSCNCARPWRARPTKPTCCPPRPATWPSCGRN